MSMPGRRRDPDPVDLYVGARIRERRIALALTQAELARALGLTEQQVRRMERGSSRLAPRQLLVLADRLAVGIGYFLDGAPALGPSEPNLPEVAEIIQSFQAIRDDVMRRDLFLLVQAAARRSPQRGARGQA